MILWQLFYTFFKIGLFTFGGGYAMIPMIQDEILAKGWADLGTIIDFIAVSESTPGPFAVNISTFLGNRVGGLAGAAFSTLGVILPSFLVILLIAKYFGNFKDNKYVKAALGGLRPAVVGLIAAAALSVGMLAFIGSAKKGGVTIDLWAVAIFAVVFGVSRFFKKAHPIVLIVISMGLGILCYGVLA